MARMNLERLAYCLAVTCITVGSTLDQQIVRGHASIHYDLAPKVFTAINSAMHQWGSSVNHNGMSFFPAHIPKRTLLYHGGRSADVVDGMEWFALEIDHAEMFALESACQGENCTDPNDPLLRPSHPAGYLQVYETMTDLDKILYIDGMSAAKSILGTLDTQDMLLLDAHLDPFSEFERGTLLCELGKSLSVNGFVRMEAGFELLLCDSPSAVKLLSNNKRPPLGVNASVDQGFLLEYMRSVSERAQQIGGSRVSLDFSSMISAYQYPLQWPKNISTMQLPRLRPEDVDKFPMIRTDLHEVMTRPRIWSSPNWQDVTDMIISRYQARLLFLVSNVTNIEFLGILNHLLTAYIDYENDRDHKLPIQKCSTQSIRAVKIQTPQDRRICNALSLVTERICAVLFEARSHALAAGDDHEGLLRAQHPIQDLIRWLDWSIWKQCPPCASQEVCFIASWPFGTEEDHHNPRCLDNTEMRMRHGWGSYWAFEYGNELGAPEMGLGP